MRTSQTSFTAQIDIMRNLMLLTVFLVGVFSPKAQFPTGGAGKGVPNMGHVYGKLIDSSGHPISEATVLLLNNKYDSATKKSKQVLLKGLTSTAKGEFSFEDLPVFGQLKLKISATGYKPIEQNVMFQMKMPAGGVPKNVTDPAQAINAMSSTINGFDKDLGNIKMATDITQLQGVTVSATKATLKMDIDKKVYNVEKDLVNAGGTAMDVMKNVPSVNVDIDGNLTLRNAPPILYVDGRPTTLTLDQIPANAIESVEVMTNPSSKYDASGGGAGILNIVLKKNKKTGYNGMVRAGINKYGETDGGFNFNVRQNKINFTAGINARAANGRSTGTINRTNIADTPVTMINQVNEDRNKGAMLFGRIGLDYFVTNKTTLSLSFLRMHGDIKPTSISSITSDSLYSSSIASTYSQRNTNSERIFNGQGLIFGMKHLFTKKDEEWTADANYFTGKGDNNVVYTTDNYAAKAGSSILSSQTQKIMSGGSDKNLILQSDYVLPFKEKAKLETGVRAALRSRINDNFNYIFDDTANGYVLVPSTASNYKSNDNVYAAYAAFTSSIH